MLLHAPFVTANLLKKNEITSLTLFRLLRHNCITYSSSRCNQLQLVGIALQYTLQLSHLFDCGQLISLGHLFVSEKKNYWYIF